MPMKIYFETKIKMVHNSSLSTLIHFHGVFKIQKHKYQEFNRYYNGRCIRNGVIQKNWELVDITNSMYKIIYKLWPLLNILMVHNRINTKRLKTWRNRENDLEQTLQSGFGVRFRYKEARDMELDWVQSKMWN